MSEIPSELRYTKSHEWVRTLPDGSVEIGITDHAQHSLGDLVRGLEKNMFAGIEYNPVVSIAGGLAQLAAGVAPLVLVFLTGGLVQGLLVGQVVAMLVTAGWLGRSMGVAPALALLYPLAVALFVFVLWRTMVLNLVHGGIRWRGTFYPLDTLKGNRV